MTNLQPESVSRETSIQKYFPGQEDAIRAYAEFLTTAGIERGLIGPREGERIWERHIFNCLPVTQLLRYRFWGRSTRNRHRPSST
jgi:16S rRNA (guanine527-N7)-methyltransferase